jgi:hypothetical protein
MKSKTLIFKIDRCSNATRNEAKGDLPCHSKKLIGDFIFDLEVDNWVV